MSAVTALAPAHTGRSNDRRKPIDIIGCQDDETGEPLVIFSATGTEPLFMIPAQARDVAGGLRGLIDGAATRFVVAAAAAGYRAGVIGERRGRGYALKIADNLDRDFKAITVSGLSRTVAEDLAAAFDAAADQALAILSKAEDQ